MQPLKRFLKRRPESHKGDYGRLLVVAGSRGMSGAAYLASMSALRAGCGLVYLAIPKGLNAILQRRAVEVITRPLPETRAGSLSSAALRPIRSFMKGVDAVCLGPGLSTHPATRTLVRSLLSKVSCPILVDADGLNCIAGSAQRLLKACPAPVVVSPHPGEMSRLTGIPTRRINHERRQVAVRFARKSLSVVLLKGHRTVIAGPHGALTTNRTGNPGLATAGSGDCLSGILGAFLARGARPFEAACWAAYVHGLAGDQAARRKGQTALVASDILEALPQVFKSLRR